MILVKASAGLVIEFGLGEAGKWDTLSVRLPEGLSPQPFLFEARVADGRLQVRPLDVRAPAELVIALGAILANEAKVLAEVRKYNRASG